MELSHLSRFQISKEALSVVNHTSRPPPHHPNSFALLLSVILSLNLEEDSYRKLLHPLSNEKYNSNMVIHELKGCLCIISQHPNYSDFWIMKEHGNEQSWTKLLSVPYMTDPEFYAYSRVLYVSEDDQVLMQVSKRKKFSLVIYDFRNDTFNIPKIQNINDDPVIPNIYVESLISPFSQY
ncbi:F-box protein [Trifolium pratense]|uniref:F-box protein n=1 Tax=Trifolium pratense TaxID=57577 RepID=A0A2K3M7S7_TRIPR|nr:F-box protein [Trifolium pratense]